MSGSDLVQAAVVLPGENGPQISRLVQQISLDIPVVADDRRQNKSQLPTGMSSIVSHQPLPCRPAAELHVLSGDCRHGIVGGRFGYVAGPGLSGFERVPTTATDFPETA